MFAIPKYGCPHLHMKKLSELSFIHTILAVFIFGMLVATPASAQFSGPMRQCKLVEDITTNKGTFSEGAIITAANSQWGSICLVNMINNITNWFMFIVLSIAVLAIVLAGFVALRDPPAGIKLIGGVVVGIVIVLLAQLIPAAVTGVLL